jgi:integrase
MQAHSVDDLARSSERHLRAQNKSPRTVEAYLEAVGQFAAYLRAHRKAHGGRSLAQARGEDVEAFIIDLLGRHKPSTTTNNHYRGLHAFSRWLEDEEDLPHPMRKLKPPAVPDQPVPVVGESQLQRLLAGCAGKDFEARRDTALIMLLVDAGPRRGELVGMLLDAVDFEYDVIRCSARAAGNALCRSDGRPPWRWTATSGSGPATSSRTWKLCRSASAARSRRSPTDGSPHSLGSLRGPRVTSLSDGCCGGVPGR